MNGDGNRFVDPSNDSVSIIFYGSYAEFQGDVYTPPDEGDGSTIVESRAAGGSIRWVADENSYSSEIPGWRITSTRFVDGVGITEISQTFDAGDRVIGFQAVAPTADFPRYEPLFTKLIEEIEINR